MTKIRAYGEEFSTEQILGNDYHQSLADSGQFTEEQVAEAWEKAKRIANDNVEQNPDIVPSYAYTTSIMQNLLGIKKTASVHAAQRLVAARKDRR